MDVRRRLTRWALAHPRVLLVDAQGTRLLRWQVEAELDRRRWPLALSPADADLLLVLGRPGPQLGVAVEVLWSQTTAPRHRQHIHHGSDLATQLDTGAAALIAAMSNADAPRPTPRELLANGAEDQPSDHDDEHEDHHMHQGGDVAGLAMAGTAPDRDGLVLDSLQVSLGPALLAWPTGLLVRGALQGDVLTGVSAGWVDAGWVEPSDAGAAETGVDVGAQLMAVDHLARFLSVAGWPTAARSARIARSALLSTDPERSAQGRRGAALLARRVRRSRTLAWSVRELGVASPSALFAAEGGMAGDVLARVRHWCELASGNEEPGRPASQDALVDVAVLLEGAELAAARLIVASVHLDRATADRREAAGA